MSWYLYNNTLKRAEGSFDWYPDVLKECRRLNKLGYCIRIIFNP